MIKNYLVVDDDCTNNLICEFTIKRFDRNANIELYLDPEKALSYIKEKYSEREEPLPTLLLLDVNMPTMTGFEFLDKLMQLNKVVLDQLTVYILSSSIEDFKIQAEQYPCVAGFLSKPLQLSHLEKISFGEKWKEERG